MKQYNITVRTLANSYLLVQSLTMHLLNVLVISQNLGKASAATEKQSLQSIATAVKSCSHISNTYGSVKQF